MSQQLAIRPHRSRRRPPVARLLSLQPAPASAGPGIAAPTLVMHEPEDRRSAWISGSLVTALHAAGLGGLLLFAALAPPELIERVIPVEIIRASTPVPLPGSNLEPAPAGPKAVGAARPSAAALAAAQAISPEQAEALRQAALEVARRAIEQMELDSQRQAAVQPTQVERREVEASNVAAIAAASASPSMKVDVSEIERVRIDPAELAALDVDLSGPRQVDTSEYTDLSAPEAFAVLSELGNGEYTGSVSATSVGDASSIGEIAGRWSAAGVDTEVHAAYSGGGSGGSSGSGGGGMGHGAGAGGTGTATGSVRCLESTYVQRYLDMVERRTVQRWRVPEGVAPDTRVVLRFHLDAAGMTHEVEALDIQDEILGESAMQALLSAAPFPPMDDNNRCLTAQPIKGTFKVPSH